MGGDTTQKLGIHPQPQHSCQWGQAVSSCFSSSQEDQASGGWALRKNRSSWGRIREGGPAGLGPQLRGKPEPEAKAQQLWDSNYERQAGWVRVLFPAGKKVMVSGGRNAGNVELCSRHLQLSQGRGVSFMPLADRTYVRDVCDANMSCPGALNCAIVLAHSKRSLRSPVLHVLSTPKAHVL